MIRYQCEKCDQIKPTTRTMKLSLRWIDESTRTMGDPNPRVMHLCVTCVEDVLRFINNVPEGR